jgi:hypothetical protein
MRTRPQIEASTAINIVNPEVQISSQPTAEQIAASSQPKPLPVRSEEPFSYDPEDTQNISNDDDDPDAGDA